MRQQPSRRRRRRCRRPLWYNRCHGTHGITHHRRGRRRRFHDAGVFSRSSRAQGCGPWPRPLVLVPLLPRAVAAEEDGAPETLHEVAGHAAVAPRPLELSARAAQRGHRPRLHQPPSDREAAVGLPAARGGRLRRDAPVGATPCRERRRRRWLQPTPLPSARLGRRHVACARRRRAARQQRRRSRTGAPRLDGAAVGGQRPT